MSDTNAQKGLSGPFNDQIKDGEFYTYDKDGKAIALSPAVLMEGTATSFVPQIPQDPDIGPFMLNQGEVSFDPHTQSRVELAQIIAQEDEEEAGGPKSTSTQPCP